MAKPAPDRWHHLGAFIREQRAVSRLSLRRLSELAGISNPYLSQIERGLRRPSAEILQQIAKALRISAETLYVQAGILEPGEDEDDLSRQILADRSLSEEQKQALVRIYLSFRHENDGARHAGPPEPRPGGSGARAPDRDVPAPVPDAPVPDAPVPDAPVPDASAPGAPASDPPAAPRRRGRTGRSKESPTGGARKPDG